MLLEMVQITKKFGSFAANAEVDFSLREGEVHAIVGENGAGKTTLMKILYGMEQPTSGKILLRGIEKNFSGPTDAITNGIGMVHQHFMLFPSFTVAENIVIGSEPAQGLLFDRKEAARQVKELCKSYRLPIEPAKKLSECSVGMQQRVEILKVLYQKADIIILDEPTAVLTPLEVQELLATIKFLAQQGKSIILITHKLHEVMEVSDRITVLRNGRVTGVLEAKNTDVEELSRLMVGRDLAGLTRTEGRQGQAVLELQEVHIQGKKGKPLLDKISFTIHAGEIVGIAGVSGNGQSELIQAITGLKKVDRGQVTLLGTDITNKPVQSIRERGLAHIPEDRYLWGAAKDASVKENMLMGHYRKKSLQRHGILKHQAIEAVVNDWVKLFSVKTTSIYEKVQNLSGGNLQKLIVAREMGQETPFVLAAEPTRGVDIGAMEFIHKELLTKRDSGGAVLLISSELSEIMTLSDRILVMYEGRIIGEVSGEAATEEQIGLLMAGGKRHA